MKKWDIVHAYNFTANDYPEGIWFVNMCLVCLYLFAGHCSEYNKGGNLIQANMQTNCMTFANKPCPNFYRSGEAYKCEF